MPKVLVVDDNEEIIETLERIFSFYQFEVIGAYNGAEAIELAEKEKPDIIILDALMPVMDGFEACKILKSKNSTREIPIVFLTANYTDAENRITGLELGADDYLLKPFNSRELVARIKTILKKNELMHSLKKKNEELILSNEQIRKELETLQKKAQDLEEYAYIDQLTGLYNKSFFNKRLREEFHRAIRYETPLSLILIDVDSFERINEVLGYQIGDYILMKMSNIILNNTRITDIVARFGGEEFAVLLPQTDDQGAYFEAERLRVSLDKAEYIDESIVNVKNLSRRRQNEYKHLTVSLGVATYPMTDQIKSEKDLVKAAEEALGHAKTQGKNKTITYQRLMTERAT